MAASAVVVVGAATAAAVAAATVAVGAAATAAAAAAAAGATTAAEARRPRRRGGRAARLRPAQGLPVLRRQDPQGRLQGPRPAQVLRDRARQDHPPADQRQLRPAPARRWPPPSSAPACWRSCPTRWRAPEETNVKLILREDVENLGKGGELVEVKPGYGRNYLLPRGLAVRGQPQERPRARAPEEDRRGQGGQAKASAQAVAKRLSDTPVTLKRKVGDQDKLYGSVTALDIVEALAARGLQLDRRLHRPGRSHQDGGRVPGAGEAPPRGGRHRQGDGGRRDGVASRLQESGRGMNRAQRIVPGRPSPAARCDSPPDAPSLTADAPAGRPSSRPLLSLRFGLPPRASPPRRPPPSRPPRQVG